MKNIVLSFVRNDEGQDLIEYALLAGFISLSCVAVLLLIGPNLSALYTAINDAITDAQ